ncbi:MAG: hypothetical protein J5612_00065, partial [Paludibacteraceae bacterium]|nr:hypothetical protein [Paludibacteraceae bacterium]
DATGFQFLHVDIYPLADGSIMIYPVNKTPAAEYKTTVDVKGGEWNHIVIDLSDKDLSDVWQIGWINYYALNGFFIDNVYFAKKASVWDNLKPSEAFAIIDALDDGATVEGKYIVTGYVTKVDYTYTAANGITVWLDDAADGVAKLQLFKANPVDEESQAIKVGDKVQAKGTTFQKYLKSGNVIPEMVKPDVLLLEAAAPFDPAGEGTEDSPYLVADVIGLDGADTDEVWVIGYILGAWNSSTKDWEINVTNIVLADADDETEQSKMIPIQLPSGAVRSALNIQDNDNLVGAQVMVKGLLQRYLGVPGVKSTSDYKIKSVPAAINNVENSASSVKIMRDGQLYIIRDGKMYNVVGAEVK